MKLYTVILTLLLTLGLSACQDDSTASSGGVGSTVTSGSTQQSQGSNLEDAGP